MASSDDDNKEVNDLTEIYDVLKGDAKRIINDLQGGVVMWREAAGANVATGGFLLILALTSFRYYSSMAGEAGAIIIAEVILAMVMFGIAAKGLRKYFKLRSRYVGLFERAKKLE